MANNNKNTDKNNENDVKNAENAQNNAENDVKNAENAQNNAENDVKNAENAQNNAENKNNENNKEKSVKPVKVRFLIGYWGIYGTFQAGEKASIPENVAKAFVKDKVCEILKDKE